MVSLCVENRQELDGATSCDLIETHYVFSRGSDSDKSTETLLSHPQKVSRSHDALPLGGTGGL